MDLLFSKYASPFLLLDGYIQIGSFNNFIEEFINIKDDEKSWEFYLHKIHDKSFMEFKESMKIITEPVKEEQIETTIVNSQNMLSGFIPDERG